MKEKSWKNIIFLKMIFLYTYGILGLQQRYGEYRLTVCFQ